MRQLTLPPSIYPAGALPHGWLLPHCCGIVHHGGFGTTSAGLRAGNPAKVVPHIADPFFWGQHLHQLSVGMPFIPRSRLKREGLAAVLKELAYNEKLHPAASILGEKIRTEKGVDNAIRLIEETFYKWFCMAY